MEPVQGQIVDIFFRNGQRMTGEVIEWSEKESVLKSLSSDQVAIIKNVEADVQMVVISNPKPSIKQREQVISEMEEEFETIKEQEPINHNQLRLMKLAELKEAMNKQQKEIIGQRLRSYNIGEVKPVQYGGLLAHK
jgi:hypothetical protein